MVQKILDMTIEQKYWQQGLSAIAGIDEAGRGPLAGPVVAAAVVFDQNHNPIDGVYDSKKISEKKRELLYEKILSEARVVGIGMVDHRMIDKINILNATYKAMRMAIGQTRLNINFLLFD